MREGSSDAGRGPHAIQHALSRAHCATQTRAHLFVAGLLVAREELRVEVRRIVLVEHLHHDRPPSAWESAPAPLRTEVPSRTVREEVHYQYLALAHLARWSRLFLLLVTPPPRLESPAHFILRGG